MLWKFSNDVEKYEIECKQFKPLQVANRIAVIHSSIVQAKLYIYSVFSMQTGK